MFFLLLYAIGVLKGQTSDQRFPGVRLPEESRETSDQWVLEPVVQVRWDFSSCGKNGMYGPDQEDCEVAYSEANLKDYVIVKFGVQSWVVPADGLYLVTAAGPSGSSVGAGGRGQGAILEANFHLMKGEIIDIIVGQRSDYDLNVDTQSKRGLGGSGGTFVVRRQDSKILMAAGGGGGGAGRSSNMALRDGPNDATIGRVGKNASIPDSGRAPESDFACSLDCGGGGFGGMGGVEGQDFKMGFYKRYGGGGGAGFGLMDGPSKDGDGGVHSAQGDHRPRAAKNFLEKGTGMNSRGVGGYLQFKSQSTLVKVPITNNGGFGGGGYGSADGGAGGGGGYSGGGGGPPDGFSGGGGSMNNGFRQKNDVSNQGDGYVRISFIGQQCCGPMDVYIAMAFIAGILAKLLFTYGIYWSFKTFRRMHTSYVIISHLKELKREAHQLETDEVYLVDRVLREQEDLKSRMGASRPDLRRRVSGRKRTRDESEYTETEYSESYSQSYSQTQTAQTSESQYSDNSQSTVIENKAPDSDESESDASTIVERTKHQSMMQSQALTNVTALSKKSLNQNEPDSILAASTAIGTLKGRAKMDAMNKSARSGIYSTIGRNAKMPEEDDDDEDGNELAEVMARRSAAASRRTLTSERGNNTWCEVE